MSTIDLKNEPLVGGMVKTEDFISPEVRNFCAQEGILQYAEGAIDLVQHHFESIQDLALQLQEDPETGEKWAAVDVTIRGELDEILDAYDRYTGQWVTSAPWPERDKIRLSYNIV